MRPRSGSSNAAGGGTPKSRARTLYEGDGCRVMGDRANERASPIAHHRERSEHSPLVDLDTMLLRCLLDAVLDRLHFVGIVLGRVVLVIDIAPRGADVLRRINRVFLVRRVGELDIAILTFPFFRTHVISPLDLR